VEKNDPKKQTKRNKIIIIAIVIFLLLLLLVKLYFEFRAERERLFEFRAEKERIEQESQNRKSLIDSLCNIFPDDCEKFERFGNVGSLMIYIDSLLDKQRLRALIDSLCEADSINCDKYRSFTDIDELRRFAGISGENGKDGEDSDYLRKKEIADSIAREREQEKKNGIDARRLREKAIADSIEQDNLKKKRLNALIDSLCAADPENCDKYRSFTDIDELRRFLEELKNQRSLREKFLSDSLAEANRRPVCQDTTAPWVYPEPTGGLYFEPIRVQFSVSKPGVSVFFKRSADGEFRLWGGEFISISRNTELFYYAADDCGNQSEVQKKIYEFRDKQTYNACPDGMVLVESARGNFCIDQFLWRNEKGVRPTNMVSQAQARDSCVSVGKRLCTAEEWTTACKGPYNWRYPYGDKYIRRACITQDSTFRPNGEAGECRGWYAIYDMVGNLAEWTSTRAPENQRHFLVMGGFWESGAAASCEMARYSYFPQNQHNQVGFRCCKSLE